jgi:hypothetical protein
MNIKHVINFIHATATVAVLALLGVTLSALLLVEIPYGYMKIVSLWSSRQYFAFTLPPIERNIEFTCYYLVSS